MSVGPDINNAWINEDRAARIRLSKIGCVLALILIPAGVTLDVLVYPSHLTEFFVLRVVTDIFVVSILVAHFTVIGSRHVYLLTLAWLIAPQVAISYMIYVADGFDSSYYAGLNLAILGMGTVLPVTVIEVALLSAMTLLLYFVAGVAHASGESSVSVIYNNAYFLLSTALISGTAVYFNGKRRFREFQLNFELNSRNQQLAELDRVKSEFFANISHELRTPLTLILAPLERLLQESTHFSKEVVDKLGLIQLNGFRLLRLVNDLLEVIRLEESGLELDRRPLRLDSLITTVLDTMSHLAETRGIAFKPDLDNMPVWIAGDRGALEKIFFNLLSNAIKFTNAGGEIAIRSHFRGDAVLIDVEDTGIGIGTESLPYVFGRFRQADSSTTRRYSGTGLGLALVKELTERHGGEVSITSAVGQGTTVCVTLPTLAADSVTPEMISQEAEDRSDTTRWLDLAAQQSALAAPEEPVSDIAGCADSTAGTVLVIDDEPDMRRYLIDLLRDEYRVIVARDGQEGLDLVRRYRPELVVLDLMLPEIDGLEVCRIVKQDPELRSARIVLLTARAEEPSKLVALENGADDFLTKPFSSIEVRTRLRNLRRSAELELDLYRRNDELQNTLTELRDTQDKLVHSEKLNALGRLSAGLLHEINNPLNYTLTAIEFARNDPVLATEEDLKDTLADIDNGMQRIRGIVKELRAFAYPAKNARAEFRLSAAIDPALQILAHEARQFRIHNRIDEDWLVVGSSNHITQVVVNLLSNAFKALRGLADNRNGEVSLSARRDDGRVVLRVRDNGPGISRDVMERVFDPFYTTADVGEGMGMGLSVCQTIIRNHGGNLVVDSVQGEWTEFTFDLPLAETRSADSVQDDERVRA